MYHALVIPSSAEVLVMHGADGKAKDAEAWPNEPLAILVILLYLLLGFALTKINGGVGWIFVVLGIVLIPAAVASVRDMWRHRRKLRLRQAVAVAPMVIVAPLLFVGIASVFVSGTL